MEKYRWNYHYETLKDGERQYDNYDFSTSKIVDAKYIHAEFDIDKGNPFIEALPLPRNESEVIRTYEIPIYNYRKDEIANWSIDKKKRALSSLHQLRIALPFHIDLEDRFYDALITSYRSRNLYYDPTAHIPTYVSQKESTISCKTYGEAEEGTNAGFNLLGLSGCGKSSALKILLQHYPQVIYHHPKGIPQFPQIVYLVINCIPNSNFKSLYISIGAAIDRAFGNIVPIYENMIEKIHSLGGKAEKVRELVEMFSIGMIILDEIQLMDFSSTKENSFESLMILSNRTKVAISVVGTEEAHEQMFSKLRTARRTGAMINANEYCLNRRFFEHIVQTLFRYQWIDTEMILTNEIVDTLYNVSKGIINQLIDIYIFIQLDYLSLKNKPKINSKFIKRTVNKHYPGLQNLLKNTDIEFIEKERVNLVKCATNEMNKIFNSNQKQFSENIINNQDSTQKNMLDNVISNILKCHDEFTIESITNTFNKVLNIKGNCNKSELELTKLTVSMLLNSKENAESTKRNKKKVTLDHLQMVQYLTEE